MPRVPLTTILLAASALAASVCLSGEAAHRASASTTGLTLKPVTQGERAGWQRAEQALDFFLDPCHYRVRYIAYLDPKQPDRAIPGEGTIGMPAPSSCNWYHGGFLFLRVNGQDIGSTRLHRAYVAETGARAVADMVWDSPQAVVRVRFLGLPADDKLLCEVAIEPKAEIRDLRLRLRCYPSFFTAWHNRNGDRKIQTPATTVSQGQNLKLPAAQHWYAVYHDTVFDVARGEGDGPCAALFLPDDVQTVRFRPGSYAVETELVCPPAKRRIRLALWDCRGQANADVLAAFRRHARRWQRELGATDFTPAAVRAFDAAAELAKLDHLTRSPDVQRQLGDRAVSFRKRIQALTTAHGPPGILAEAELLGLLAAYREFLWELKVAALLAD